MCARSGGCESGGTGFKPCEDCRAQEAAIACTVERPWEGAKGEAERRTEGDNKALDGVVILGLVSKRTVPEKFENVISTAAEGRRWTDEIGRAHV